jgi:ornithine cyclodeaminase
MLFLSGADLRRALPMDLAMIAAASAFAQIADATAQMPPRTSVALGPAGETALVMPAYLPSSRAFGVKTLTITPRNADRDGVPVINALMTLFDTETGEPLCALDGGYLTALRTGAASGIATKLMARKNATVLALFGAGAQAYCQVWAICVARPIKRVWIFAPTRAHVESLVVRLREAGEPIPRDIQIAASSREALSEATIICAATNSPTPIFDDAELLPGAHINGIGSYLPTTHEIPGATVERARIIVDQRAAAWAEAGDLIIPRDAGQIVESQVVGELGNVVLNRLAGRTTNAEITLFKSVGIAAQDVATAQAAYERALHLGIGVRVEW